MNLDGIKFTAASKKEQAKFIAMYGSSVRVSRYTYKLVWVKSINDGHTAGLCDFNTKTIYIAIDSDEIQLTLMHEIMHAELDAAGLRQAPGFSRDFEEIICELASHAVGTNYVLRKR